MSFSSEVKNEVRNKNFTLKKRHSKIGGSTINDKQDILIDAFLRSGTISDPEKFYHMEFICDSSEEAQKIRNAAEGFGISTGIMQRKDKHVVYLKESAAITDMLVAMGATNAALQLEEVIVLKEFKGIIQRRVNCETSNIRKTVSAAVRQLEDIELIKEKIGLSGLPEGLQEAARLRTDHPDASLNELAGYLSDTGKSGLNHRFRRIARIADQLRSEQIL